MKQRWAEKQVSSFLFFKVWDCLKGAGEWPKDVNLGRNITMFAFKKALWSSPKEKANEFPIPTGERLRGEKLR